jgi:hypothetical protein
LDSTPKITSLQAAVLPVTTLEVKGKDGQTKTYSLVLDFNALAKAQEAIGKDLSTVQAWLDMWGKITPAEITAICWAALDAYHPEVTIKEVGTWLGPVQKQELFLLLIEQCWPGILERIEKWAEENKNKLGESQPNPQPGSAIETA